MSFKGIDIRATGERLVFRASLKDGTGAKVVSGAATLRLFELQSDGSLKSYDFNDNTFKTTALTTATASLTHRTGNNGTYDTGIWTYALTTVSGFTAGGVYLAQVAHASASPPEQEREFQYGSGEGDFAVTTAGGVTLGDGVTHGGTTAALRLGASGATPALYVTNSGGHAVKFEATGGNGAGLSVAGNGTGAGVLVTGGGDSGSGIKTTGGANFGYGLEVVGGGTDGDAMRLTASGGGIGLWIVTASGDAMSVTSIAGTGCHISGGGAGKGLHLESGTTSGSAIPLYIDASSNANNTAGVYIRSGTGAAADAVVLDGTRHALFSGDTVSLGGTTLAALTVSGATTLTGAVSATHASNDIRGIRPSAAGVADILTTQMTESYNADGTAPTLAQALFVCMQRLTEFAISSTTITVNKLDGVTAAYTLTMNSATVPTSSTRSA